jgi:hypothetical protein
VVHRDIKPANVLLTDRETYGIERPKITDFGVAKMAEGRTTLTGQLVGTPAFMPPEQFLGGPIDGRADLFSLGVVLYWMATGEQAFPGESITAVSYKVVHTDPVPPRKLNPWVPARLDSVIMRCLAKSPDERYQTGEELARELGKIREEGKVSGERKFAPAEPLAAASASDPDTTLAGSIMMRAAAAAAKPALAKQTAEPNVAVAPGNKQTMRLVLAVVISLGVVVGGWSAWHRRHKAAVQVTVFPEPATSATLQPASAGTPGAGAVIPQAAGPAGQETAEASSQKSPEKPQDTPTTKASLKATSESVPAPTMPAKTVLPATGFAVKKTAAKVEAKTKGVSSPKAAAVEPQPAVVDFDPKSLDPKQNAKLKIDAKHAPAGLDFTVEMNGKLYFRKTSAGKNAPDDELFVPPGVQEFRVTAKSGAIMKISNTVSAEFRAKKHITLRIEIRNQGSGSDAGIPQAIYPNTQIVVSLK